MDAKEGMASKHEKNGDIETHPGKNGIQSHAPQWVGFRYHNGLVQVLGVTTLSPGEGGEWEEETEDWNVLGSIWGRAVGEEKASEPGGIIG